tara:strand:- start:68 stop:301 length:234 start_codon:yes stop_codon:yes gene_type:complete
MALPHPVRPEGYGNHDTRPRWEIGSFKVGDVIECYQCLNGVMQPKNLSLTIQTGKTPDMTFARINPSPVNKHGQIFL